MTTTFTFKSSFIVAALLALPLANAATISKADYSAGRTRISADLKTAKAACNTVKANAKDICVEEAQAKETVARAELEFSYSGKTADQTKVLEAKAKSAYAVAKEKCDDKAGNDKDFCVKEAKAAEVKALADTKMGKQIAEAKTDATADKRDADYKVAAEKCDAMSGDAKNACIASAKARLGKT